MVFRVTYLAALLGVALSFRSAAGSAAVARPKIEPIAHASAAAGQAYTIVDVGAPPVATYPSSAPVGFNNTGQIYGVALRAAKGDRRSYAADTDCLLWTGTRYIDLAPSLSVQACTPNAMSSAAEAGGTVSVVGNFTDIHHAPSYGPGQNLDAFSALVAASGTAKLLAYYDHSPAALYGVNGSGTAVGYSYNTTNYGADFITTPPQELTWLQTGCTSPVAGCLETFNFLYDHTLNGEPSLQCPFGGCILTDAGAVLGFDYVTKAYALYTGGTASSIEIPLPYAQTFVVSINNARQILYFTRPVGIVPSVYDVTAGTSISVPPVAGTNCVNYYPISMNDAEEILGYTSRCSGRDFYWTWDPRNGTRSVNAALPASAFTVTPFGVNDLGQILVSLLPKTGPAHWGTLDPPGAPAARRERVKGVANVR